MTVVEGPARWSCTCGAKGEEPTFAAAAIVAQLHKRKVGGRPCRQLRVIEVKQPKQKGPRPVP